MQRNQAKIHADQSQTDVHATKSSRRPCSGTEQASKQTGARHRRLPSMQGEPGGRPWQRSPELVRSSVWRLSQALPDLRADPETDPYQRIDSLYRHDESVRPASVVRPPAGCWWSGRRSDPACGRGASGVWYMCTIRAHGQPRNIGVSEATLRKPAAFKR